ncbi:O-succinylbenzoate synthase [Okibacterium sp. HSC-33S16]|uniref:o-succinylbenzoate synthase n=1 Tax=Okibacterium sp. HSC-33S16 TaxID=2910965 RepID=UPI00209DE5DA|nr:o-succinylbenzoate synthase [Okibacterium sp. HSC-33S16]MCP2032037.1 O-succinylbenzoate synthase [Okibacterium sp. HSC-33S16]
MRVESITLHRVGMPLVRPFETSFGRETERDVLLVELHTDSGVGWGECVAGAAPNYSSEYVDGCAQVIERHLAPLLLSATAVQARDLTGLFAPVVGHRMAKAALEAAVLDAELRASGISMATFLGAERTEVECGVSVGISPTIDELLTEVQGYVNAGYRRIKLKVKPGWDIEPVRRVRELIGADLGLQVDANTAYTRDDIAHLGQLDEFDLLLIEQPFDEEDIASHVELARVISTPVCLDESIVSVGIAIDAIERGATSIINIKPGRVGGYLPAVAIHDACVGRGVPVWCGGMLETGIGRAMNVALAALPGFTLPGDTSASDRYYREDLTEPFVLSKGRLAVPTGPGSGITVRTDLVQQLALMRPRTLRP